MTKLEKKSMIEMINALMENVGDVSAVSASYPYGFAVWEKFSAPAEEKPLSEKTQAILDYIIAETNNGTKTFTAKSIGEGLGVSGRSISGSMNTLVDRGYVSKEGKDPTTYTLN